MTTQDKEFINTSIKSGFDYGYPKCCVEAFISDYPSKLKSTGATPEHKRRYEAGCIDGNFTGFIPCLKHADQILSGSIEIGNLINYKRRKAPLRFPLDWSIK